MFGPSLWAIAILFATLSTGVSAPSPGAHPVRSTTATESGNSQIRGMQTSSDWKVSIVLPTGNGSVGVPAQYWFNFQGFPYPSNGIDLNYLQFWIYFGDGQHDVAVSDTFNPGLSGAHVYFHPGTYRWNYTIVEVGPNATLRNGTSIFTVIGASSYWPGESVLWLTLTGFLGCSLIAAVLFRPPTPGNWETLFGPFSPDDQKSTAPRSDVPPPGQEFERRGGR